MGGGNRHQVTYRGVIESYLRSKARQYNRYLLVRVLEDLRTSRIDSLVGFKVIAQDSRGNRYVGRVVRVHGRGVSRTVVVRMRKGIPGQLLGGRVLILGT